MLYGVRLPTPTPPAKIGSRIHQSEINRVFWVVDLQLFAMAEEGIKFQINNDFHEDSNEGNKLWWFFFFLSIYIG